MNTNQELERIIRDWLDERAVEPPRISLPDAMARVATTPQPRRRWLGRWLDRGQGATRRADGRGTTDTDTGRNRRMLGMTGVAGIAAALTIIAALVVPRGGAGPTTFPAAGEGRPLVVAADGSGDFSTISEAVAAAADGATVMVKPGEYVESVVIDKDITLEGDGPRDKIIISSPTPAPIDANGDALSTLTLKSSDAVVRSLTIRPPSGWGAVLVSGGAPLFEDVAQVTADVPDSAGTFWFTDRTTATVQGSAWDGFWYVDGAASPTLEGNQAWGDAYIVSGTTVLRGNTFTGCCLRVQSDAEITIEDNRFDRGDGTNTEPGIRISDVGTKAWIVRNTINGMGTGISMQSGSSGTVKDNVLTDNLVGISWSTTGSGAIEGNTVSGGRTGLIISGGSPTVTGNTIEGADRYGISIGNYAMPTLTGNSVCGARTNLYIAGGVEAQIGENDICEDATPSGG